jgi:hypothetical protein
MVTLERTGGVTGGCVRFEMTQGRFYPQLNAHNADGTRGFAREYVAGTWRWNTYNRLSFWIQVPTSNRPMDRSGRETMQVGTFVKRIQGQDAHSDETGGGHWYHLVNLPATGTWTKVVLNMHPHHLRGASGSTEHGDRPHPTNEPEYNYFDTLTRLYIEAIGEPYSYPAVFRLDEFQFYQEVHHEADEQVYSIAATYVPAERRMILTWSRNKNENDVPHEVRYAFESIHLIGWDKATPAPGGMIAPPGFQGYNGMVYTTTDIPLEGRQAIFFAIRPANAARFSQVELPDLPGGLVREHLRLPGFDPDEAVPAVAIRLRVAPSRWPCGRRLRNGSSGVWEKGHRVRSHDEGAADSLGPDTGKRERKRE